MKTFYVLPILLAALATSASAQKSPYAGRWDLTVTPQTGSPFPQWMEITEKDGKLEGRFQPRGGAWRPLAAAKVDSGHLILTLAEATPRGRAYRAGWPSRGRWRPPERRCWRSPGRPDGRYRYIRRDRCRGGGSCREERWSCRSLASSVREIQSEN